MLPLLTLLVTLEVTLEVGLRGGGETARRHVKGAAGVVEGGAHALADYVDTAAWVACGGADVPSASKQITRMGDATERWMDENLFEGMAPEAGLLTSREIGQLTAVLGTQAALALSGATEVKLGLKALGAAGAAKKIVDAVEANPEEWATDPAFWTAVAEAVLFFAGLAASSAGRKVASAFVRAAPRLLAGAPAVAKLAYDRANVDGPERREVIARDVQAVVKAAWKTMLQIVEDAGSPERGGGTQGGTAEGSASAA
jgi:hypothetical protein